MYEQWKTAQENDAERRIAANGGTLTNPGPTRFNAQVEEDVRVGDLGSGSDYTPFIQHLGVPSTDIGSEGSYGVYHSAFDNYNWFIKFADPTFVYEQQQARVFGLEIIHMADTDVLPYDYQLYGKEILSYLETAQKHATAAKLNVDFAPTLAAAHRFEAAGTAIHSRQLAPPTDPTMLNHALRGAEGALLNPDGLPHRSWYKHTIYAPGEFTGYAAVVIPGVNEGISEPDAARAQMQLGLLTDALNRSAAILEGAAR